MAAPELPICPVTDQVGPASEALKAFEELRDTIAREVSSLNFRLEAVKEEDRMGLDRSRTLHGEFDIFSSAPSPAQAPRPQAQQAIAQHPQNSGNARPMPVHVDKQCGRNDPCWCGSGKKYKQCCGKDV